MWFSTTIKETIDTVHLQVHTSMEDTCKDFFKKYKNILYSYLYEYDIKKGKLES